MRPLLQAALISALELHLSEAKAELQQQQQAAQALAERADSEADALQSQVTGLQRALATSEEASEEQQRSAEVQQAALTRQCVALRTAWEAEQGSSVEALAASHALEEKTRRQLRTLEGGLRSAKKRAKLSGASASARATELRRWLRCAEAESLLLRRESERSVASHHALGLLVAELQAELLADKSELGKQREQVAGLVAASQQTAAASRQHLVLMQEQLGVASAASASAVSAKLELQRQLAAVKLSMGELAAGFEAFRLAAAAEAGSLEADAASHRLAASRTELRLQELVARLQLSVQTEVEARWGAERSLALVQAEAEATRGSLALAQEEGEVSRSSLALVQAELSALQVSLEASLQGQRLAAEQLAEKQEALVSAERAHEVLQGEMRASVTQLQAEQMQAAASAGAAEGRERALAETLAAAEVRCDLADAAAAQMASSWIVQGAVLKARIAELETAAGQREGAHAVKLAEKASELSARAGDLTMRVLESRKCSRAAWQAQEALMAAMQASAVAAPPLVRTISSGAGRCIMVLPVRCVPLEPLWMFPS